MRNTRGGACQLIHSSVRDRTAKVNMDEAAAKLKREREQNNVLLRASALGLIDDVKALVEMGADLECQARSEPLLHRFFRASHK